MDGEACLCDLSYLVLKRREPTVCRYSVNSEKCNKMQRKKRTTIPGNCTKMYTKKSMPESHEPVRKPRGIIKNHQKSTTKKEQRTKSEPRENAQKCAQKKSLCRWSVNYVTR